jgi:hypothetical protein
LSQNCAIFIPGGGEPPVTKGSVQYRKVDFFATLDSQNAPT